MALARTGISRTPRKRKCLACREWFQPPSSFARVCSPMCAHQAAQDGIERARKRKRREDRQRVKTRGELLREAQAAFNEWVRERDHDEPCISCGRQHQGQWHAGHYRTTAAAPELRFEPLNVAKQCAPCNNHKSGNLIEYRIGLVAKIGEDKVQWLEGPREPKRYTREDLEQIKKTYRAKARSLRKQREGAE